MYPIELARKIASAETDIAIVITVQRSGRVANTMASDVTAREVNGADYATASVLRGVAGLVCRTTNA
jgi:hypothetical protein